MKLLPNQTERVKLMFELPNPDYAARLDVQRSQLEEWKDKLLPEPYADLLAWVTDQNAKLAMDSSPDAYLIVRGTDLSTFVENWTPILPPLCRRTQYGFERIDERY